MIFLLTFFFPLKNGMRIELVQYENENEDFPIAQAEMKWNGKQLWGILEIGETAAHNRKEETWDPRRHSNS